MTGQSRSVPQSTPAVMASSLDGAVSGQAVRETQSSTAAPAPSWRKLRVAAEIFNDYQQFRIAATNRAERGHVPAEEFADLLDGLKVQERELAKVLRGHYRAAVPESVRRFQANALGLGEHTFARLLGMLGDPRIAHPWHWELDDDGKRVGTDPIADAPFQRSVSQLWSYCGLGDARRKRRSGMTATEAAACGSPRLRSLMFVIAEGCVKQMRSPYRFVYDRGRADYASRVDEKGEPWSAARQHAAAMRLVAKEILRDLWTVAGESEATVGAKPIPHPPHSLATGEPEARAGAIPTTRSPHSPASSEPPQPYTGAGETRPLLGWTNGRAR